MENPQFIDLISSEFKDYRILEDSNIPKDVMKEVTAAYDARLDIICGYLNSMRDADGIRRFENLPRADLLVLTISRSNPGEERIFSMTAKNNTCFWPNLDPDETSGSMITIKLAMQDKNVAKMALKPKFVS